MEYHVQAQVDVQPRRRLTLGVAPPVPSFRRTFPGGGGVESEHGVVTTRLPFLAPPSMHGDPPTWIPGGVYLDLL